MQLPSKSGFIFTITLILGIYYSTSGHESPLQQSYRNITLGSEVFI